MRQVLLVLAMVLVAGQSWAQTTRTVCASGCNFTTLQAAVNAASLGDTITLAANETFTGTVSLPNKSGASYLTIKSNTSASNMPAADVRVSASHASFMPNLQATSGGGPALQFEAGAHHYRFQWIEVLPNPQGHNTQIAVGYADNSQVIPSQQPHDIIFDQMYVHGDPVYGQKRAFELNGTNVEIRNSRVENIYAVGQDSQCIAGWNGRGPYTIYNNYLDCGTENIMFGGADPTLRTWLTVSGSPSATSASVAVSETGGHTLADLMLNEPISIMTAGGIRHTILRTRSGVGTSGTITYDSIGTTPSTGTSMIRQDSVAMDISIRRNHITKQAAYMVGVLQPPSSVAALAQPGVGSLPVGTYCYVIAGVNASGGYQGQEIHSAGSSEVCATLNSPGRVRLTYTLPTGATTATIWRGTSSGNQTGFYEGVLVSPFYDDGSLSYTSWSPVPGATKWQIKNLFEIKAARRLQMDSNILENSWCGSDICFGVWLKSVNQDNNCWNCGSRDLIFERNVVRHVMGFMELHGTEAAGGQVLPPPMTNVTIRNNLVYDSNSTWSDTGETQYAFFIGDYVVNLTLEHNTVDHITKGLFNLDGAFNSHTGAVMRGNLFRRADFGIHSSFGEGSAALADFFPSYVFTTNVVADAPSGSYPSGNFYPDSATFQSQFVSYSASGSNAITDWALNGASIYNNAAWDGTDIGADIIVVNLAVDGVATTGGSSSLAITTTSIPNGALTAAYSTTFAATGGTQSSTQTVRIGHNTGNTYSGVTDIDFKEAFPTTNYEGQTDLEIVRWTTGDVTNSLIKFTGLSNIPSNAQVTSATIYLYLESAGQSGIATTVQARRLLRNWTAAQSTWNSYSTGNAWTTAGALGDGTDRVSTVSASTNVGETLGYQAFTGSQLVSDIQGMIAGTLPNYGWVFQRNDGLDDFQWRNFTATEGTNGQRPYLEITYTVGGSYSWAVSAGTLPTGLALNSGSGALTGTPTGAGTSTFTIRVTDAVSATTTRQFSMIVRSAVTVSTTSPLTGGQVQAPYSVNLAASNDEPPYTWSFVSGTIPSGLSFNASGTLSGIPTTAGVYGFTVRVTGALGSTATQLYSATMGAGPTIGTGASVLTADRMRLTYGPCMLYSGSGSPEGVLTGRPCDMYIDTVGGAWYTKWSGTDTTGWGVGHNADARVNGDLVINGGNTGSPDYVSRLTGWRIDETAGADFRFLYADEMHVQRFIADLEQALAGGQIIAKSVAKIDGSFICPAASSTSTLRVEDLPSANAMRVFEIGDYVVVRSFSRAAGSLSVADCVGTVSNPITPGGTQTWTFTRAATANAGSMPTGTVVTHGSLVIDYGTAGNGVYEVSAVDGTYGINSPYSQIWTWTTAPTAANKTLRARMGNLRGVTGQTEYGAIFGTYGSGAAQYIRASNQAVEIHNVDFSIFDGSTEVIRLDRSQKSLAIGSSVPTAYGTGTGIWMGNDSGTYKLRVGNPSGNRLTWDGSTLTVVGDGGGVTNINGANIQTGTVSAAKLTVGTGRNLIRNSDCSVGTTDWEYGTTSAVFPNFVAPSFSPYMLLGGNNTCYVNSPGTPASGTLSFFFTSTATLIPVVAGNKYEASGYMGIHRSGNSYVAIQWFTFDGSFISQVNGTNCTASNAGGVSLASWCRSGVLGNAPGNAATARVVFYTTHTGEATPYMFVVHSYFGEALANQTEFTPWGAAGLTEIIGGMIRTSTITADKISVGSLSALTANVGTLTSGTINGVTAVFGGGAVTLNSSGITIAGGTSTANKITWTGSGEIYGNGNGDLLLESDDSISLIAPGLSSISVSNGNIFLDPSPSGTITTHFIGGGTRFVCVNNSGDLFSSTTACN